MPVFVPSTAAPTHAGRFRDSLGVDLAALVGVPFLTDMFGPLARIVVEAAFGADLNIAPSSRDWVDISTDVRLADGGQVSISPMGRSDEASTAQPAGCGFVIDNTSGDYTAYNTASRWYPYVRRNTPIRVRVNLTGAPGDWSIRFQGYVTTWKPSWDISGNMPIVSVQAQGITRRLSQGKTPVLSAMRRSYDFDTNRPVAYWPLEGGKDATVAYDVITGAPSAVGGFTGLTDNAGAPQFGVGDLGLGSGPVANIAGGWNLDLNLPKVTGTGQVTLQWAVCFGTTVRTGSYLKCGVRLDPSYADKHLSWSVYINDSGLIEVQWLEADRAFGLAAGPTTVYSAGSENIFDGKPRQMQLVLAASGATNVAWTLYENDVQLGSGTVTPSYSGAMNAGPFRVAAFSGAAADRIAAFGHVGVWTTVLTPARYQALNAYRGETATARLLRLCGEQGVPISIIGSSIARMGPQGLDPFLTLLRECETADQGVLVDGLGPGLTYVSSDARYNVTPALTADMSADPPQIGHPFEPVDDDQRDRNVAKVDRKNGGTYTYTQTDGPKGTNAIDVYDTSLTVSIESDAVLPDYAAWLTHLGTIEGFRYPRLTLDLAAVPAVAPGWLATGVSGRIDVTNVTSAAAQHPAGTVKLLLEGWSEQLSPFDWTAQCNTSPFDPWRVAQFAADSGDTSEFAARGDTDGAILAAGVDATATSFTVSTLTGPLWTQYSVTPDDFPFDINVGGEQIRVDSVVGASSPQTFNVTRSRNGAVLSHPVNDSVSLWAPPVLAL